MSDTNNQEGTEAERGTVLGTGTIWIIIVILALIIGGILLWRWFLKEDEDAKLFNKFTGLVRDTVNLAIGGGAIAALGRSQPEEVQRRMSEEVMAGIGAGTGEVQQEDEEEVDEFGLTRSGVPPSRYGSHRREPSPFTQNMQSMRRQLELSETEEQQPTEEQQQPGGVTFSETAQTSDGGEVLTRQPAAARKKIKNKGKKGKSKK